MIHFQDYEEYRSVRNQIEASRATQESTPHSRTELVMEDNTIYEIDTECEECLKRFWRWKAEKLTEK